MSTTPELTADAALQDALAEKTIGFAHLLRAQGFTVGLRESQDALAVAECFLCRNFEDFRCGLRSLLCLSVEQFARFDALFEAYWQPQDGAGRIRRPKRIQMPAAARHGHALLQTVGLSEEPTEEGDTEALSGASGLEALRRVDFSQVPVTWEEPLARLAARLWQRMRLRKPSRRAGAHHKRRPHFRRILRRSLATGGEPLELILAGHRPRRPRLVLLLDVSGSMEVYSLFFLRFAHALQRRFRRVHAFLFSTHLEDVTADLAVRDVQGALSRLSRRRMGWNSGTRIGESLGHLVRNHGPRVLRADTVLVILSDGLDVGPPEQLAGALREARLRAGRIVWLNPLLGIEGYAPIAQGMQAALPLIDVFAPAHNLDSLLASERHLVV
ncbi:MAG TPA: VWA domain-containing protein [bacterium]|nr:VWA domain-containing protein [bacterium]